MRKHVKFFLWIIKFYNGHKLYSNTKDLKEKTQDFKKAFENILNHNDIDLERFYLEWGIDTSINSNFESSLIKDFLETLNQNDVIRLFKENKQQGITSLSTTLQTILVDSSQVDYESGIEILDLFLKVRMFVFLNINSFKRKLEMELITTGLDNQGKLKKLCSEIIDNSSKKIQDVKIRLKAYFLLSNSKKVESSSKKFLQKSLGCKPFLVINQDLLHCDNSFNSVESNLLYFSNHSP